MDAGAKDPNCVIDILLMIGRRPMPRACDHGRQKRLRGLDHMRKLHRPLSLLYRVEFARDWFARRDAFQKPCSDGFFHGKVYVQNRSNPNMPCDLRAKSPRLLHVLKAPKSRFSIPSLGQTPQGPRKAPNASAESAFHVRPSAIAG